MKRTAEAKSLRVISPEETRRIGRPVQLRKAPELQVLNELFLLLICLPGRMQNAHPQKQVHFGKARFYLSLQLRQ
jgi:hypothetical protein